MGNYLEPELIGNTALTPTMHRVRSGTTQLFREDKGNYFITDKNADVIIEAPEQHIYAELIEGKWYWVNGCDECKGQKYSNRTTYLKCVKHDVCETCKTSRRGLKETPWGTHGGFQCTSCSDTEHEEEKIEALKAMEGKYKEYDYEGISEVRCPYCNFEYTDDIGEYYESNNEEEQCVRCDNKFTITAEQSVSFTMKRI